MNQLTFAPDEFDAIADTIILNFVDQTKTHLQCICKKKQHKNCPRHSAMAVMKALFDQRQPIGDKLLHQQLRKNESKIHSGA
jgi:hypothetical protein